MVAGARGEVLGGDPAGEVRCLLAHLGLGGLHREGDPDPVTVGYGPVPRFAVRLVALEAALWEGGREPPTAAELAEEAGLELSIVDRALQILGARIAEYVARCSVRAALAGVR